ncbi:MAG: hypothetical protein ACI8O8_002420 [Oleiphilaceae bacterium]|jgi:hypothetical protein
MAGYLFFTIKFFCSQGFASYKKGTTETIDDILQFGLPAIAYSSTFFLDDTKGRDEFYWFSEQLFFNYSILKSASGSSH